MERELQAFDLDGFYSTECIKPQLLMEAAQVWTSQYCIFMPKH